MNFIDQLRAEAIRLGFVFCGITTPETPDHFDIYLNWLNNGYHGSMTYLSSDFAVKARMHPDTLLSGCKSIIILGYPYHISRCREGQKKESQPIPYGRIAAYARSIDYHLTIPHLLQSLIAWLESKLQQPVKWQGFTDSAPILERDLASRAGVGWIGKNSFLITREAGSYLFLAELMVDIDIGHEDLSSHDFCGNCQRCIQHCPTACILSDRTIDSNRCISFLTIENKGAIPYHLRTSISDMIFGCDICQDVCPWNVRLQNVFPGPDTDLSKIEHRVNLHQELSLSENEFLAKYENTPIFRTKRRGYLRNIAVALGNHKYLSSIPVLIHAFENEPDYLVRAHIAWALGEYKNVETVAFLKRMYFDEEHPDVKAEILTALELV